MTRTWRQLWKELCRKSVPAYRILVPDSVTPEITSSWRARGYQFGAGSPPPLVTAKYRHNGFRSRNVFAATTTAGLGATSLSGIALLEVAGTSLLGLTAAGVVAAASAVGVSKTGWTYFRDPRRLGRGSKEIAAKARWLTPGDLGYVPGFSKSQDTDEQRLFHLSVVIARRITTTKAWTHPVLTDHVSRVDLDQAIASIGVRLKELLDLRTELERIREPANTRQIETYMGKLAQVFASISNRVVAMYEYYEHLCELDDQLRVLENTERSKILGDRVLDVVSRTVDDENADWQFRELNIEAESHSEVIRGLLVELEDSAGEFDDLDRQIAASEKESGVTLDWKPRTEN